MSDFVLDSDVLIWHLRGNAKVAALVSTLASSGRLAVSAITRTEVLCGMLPGEERGTATLLDACLTEPVSVEVADSAAALVRQGRGKGVVVRVPDALIAATALLRNAPLYTCNPRHFAFDGLDVRPVTH